MRLWWTLGVALVLGGLAAATGRGQGGRDNMPPAGFTALFNGKDLTNWQGLVRLRDQNFKKWKSLSDDEKAELQKKANAEVLPHWSVEDGILVYDGKGNSLQTAKDYGNFELYVDWKILPKGDSGIYLRGQPQVQIWERTDKPALDKDGNFIGSGGLYNNQKNPSKPLA